MIKIFIDWVTMVIRRQKNHHHWSCSCYGSVRAQGRFLLISTEVSLAAEFSLFGEQLSPTQKISIWQTSWEQASHQCRNTLSGTQFQDFQVEADLNRPASYPWDPQNQCTVDQQTSSELRPSAAQAGNAAVGVETVDFFGWSLSSHQIPSGVIKHGNAKWTI